VFENVPSQQEFYFVLCLNINRNEEGKDTKEIRELRESKGRTYENNDSPLNIIGLLY
jgi:hypothetical protein